MSKKRIITLTTILFITTMFIFPLILRVPFVKHLVVSLLSFTKNEAYKIAYVEFFGAIIGSFIAICGSVWIQSKKDEKEIIYRHRKYACIVYNDLDLAFKDLIKIFRDVELICNIKSIKNEEDVESFCKMAIGRKIHLSPNWISDVAQLNNVLSRVEIQAIYKCYGLLLDIDRALQSGDTNQIKNIYSTHIGYLVSGNERKVYNDYKRILEKLNSLT